MYVGDDLELVNLTSHNLDFVDGSYLTPYDRHNPATIRWRDEVTDQDGLKLVRRKPYITKKEINRLENILEGEKFGVVSLPVALAVRDTRLEGQMGAVVLKSRKEKVAFKNKFSI